MKPVPSLNTLVVCGFFLLHPAQVGSVPSEKPFASTPVQTVACPLSVISLLKEGMVINTTQTIKEWETLPEDQRESARIFVKNLVITAHDDATAAHKKLLESGTKHEHSNPLYVRWHSKATRHQSIRGIATRIGIQPWFLKTA